MLLFAIIRFIASCLFFIFVLFTFYGGPIKNYYKITRKYFSVYRELISKYDAKYPCVMDHVGAQLASFHNLKGLSDFESYFFIKDEAFVIVSTLNPDIYVEIPFKSIIYHESRISGDYGKEYCFHIDIYFNGLYDIESFAFCTLDYNHKIDKRINNKYPGLLNDENLYDFVCENFPDRKEYRQKRDLERSNISFETSIFYNFD